MKKTTLALSTGILGAMLLMGSPDAEARNNRSYRGGSRVVHSSRTVVHRTHRAVVPRYQHSRVIHRHRPVVVHRTHVHTRRILRYTTRYSLRPALSPWAYSRFRGYYRSDINLFCLAHPALCIAASIPVYY